jgi:hypothetical protein
MAVPSSPGGDAFVNSTIDAPDEHVDDSQAIDVPSELVQDNNNDDDKPCHCCP